MFSQMSTRARQLVGCSCDPPMTHLDSNTLASFDAAGVHTVWEKALERRRSDPEGAIMTARTLFETVCKRILDEAGKRYAEEAELPKLYVRVMLSFTNIPVEAATREAQRLHGLLFG
jgi:hypothetical protein